MNLSAQIKKYRTKLMLSQEELAEQVFVTRQTISNWENSKSYPDIHSLLLLSSIFQISLDQLIKGDIDAMKEEINKNEIRRFNRDGAKFTLLLAAFILTLVPLYAFWGYYGLIISALIYSAGMYYALRLENQKKKYDIQTYKEILAFTEGKKLDELEKARESGKRIYQKILLAAASAVIGFSVSMFFAWLLKTYLF